MYSDPTSLMERTNSRELGMRQPNWDIGILERPRYFPRQLMTPAEMILEQEYFRDKMRRHNRLLHGWGVVCGAIVSRIPGGTSTGDQAWPCPGDGATGGWHPWDVSVSSGYILGPYGDEILINSQITVDVRKTCITGVSGDICPPAPDPWCSDVIVDRAPGHLYLAVRYKEIATRPVRVQPTGCGCDDTACEYSRIRDGYEICTLDECPESHAGDPPEMNCDIHGCPPCPDSPWVVLARIDINAEGIYEIDNYECRRIVQGGTWCRPERPEQDAKGKNEQTDTQIEEHARNTIRARVDMNERDLVQREHLLAVAEQPAVALRGVTANSTLGRKLVDEGLTIANVGRMSRDDFLDFAFKDVEQNLQNRMLRQTEETWQRAVEVVTTIDDLPRRQEVAPALPG